MEKYLDEIQPNAHWEAIKTIEWYNEDYVNKSENERFPESKVQKSQKKAK